MDPQNLAYALTQVVHNFGAAAVVGGALAPWLARGTETERSLGVLVCLGWAAQIASGSAFGAISYYYYGQFPDISGVAVGALGIKVACAAVGFSLSALFLVRASVWRDPTRRMAWHVLAGLGATALTAAAFLRWFS